MPKIPKTRDLFDISHSLAEVLLDDCEYPHEALAKIKNYIIDCASMLGNAYKEIAKDVFVANDAVIWNGSTIIGPTIVGHKAEIRPGAFIRGNVIVGDGALIGNSTEIKNSIILDEAKLPHYNYVGDSIIGFRAHMGAGTIASNLRLDKKDIELSLDEEKINTKLRKIGVFLGDYAEIGCGCVICPGAIIGREAVIYPMTTVKGVIGERVIYKGGAVNG
jgi:NDP-sugar pyrophosphorylase family protein